MNVSHLKVKKIRRGYLLINTKTGIHTHLSSEYGCYCLILFIREGIEPDNEYLRESKKRLMIENKDRQRYYNLSKGVRA